MKGADSSDWRLRAGSALALALLLAVPAAAQQEGTPPPPEEEEENILDWLGGSAEPAPETPVEPLAPVPGAPQENPLDWLTGEEPPPEEPAAPAAPDAPGDPSTPAMPSKAARLHAVASPAAQACAEKLREAMALELQVLDFEDSTIGAEGEATELTGFKKQVWDRLQQDKAGFRQLAGQMSLQALAFPEPAEGVTLSRDGLTLLAALSRAFEASRNPRAIDQYIESNRTFLKTADGPQRLRAVSMRDELVAGEIAWTSLAQQAITLASGEGDEDLVARMREVLAEVAPEAEASRDDLAVLVLRDAELRQQVLNEVTAVLTSVAPPPAPPRPDEELRPRVEELRVQLAELAGLPPLVTERAQIDKQLENIDGQLELDLPHERRKDLVGRRTALLTRRNEIDVAWYGSPPDEATFDELVATQDELVSRRMLDLGAAGVLYGTRVDMLRAVQEAGFPDTRSQWEFAEQQQALVALLDGVAPEENPLRSAILPDLWGMALMQEAQEKAAKEQELLGKSAPKPKAGKKPAGGAAKAGAKKPPKKAPMKPKPKGGGKKKGGGGKGMQKPY